MMGGPGEIVGRASSAHNPDAAAERPELRIVPFVRPREEELQAQIAELNARLIERTEAYEQRDRERLEAVRRLTAERVLLMGALRGADEALGFIFSSAGDVIAGREVLPEDAEVSPYVRERWQMVQVALATGSKGRGEA